MYFLVSSFFCSFCLWDSSMFVWVSSSSLNTITLCAFTTVYPPTCWWAFRFFWVLTVLNRPARYILVHIVALLSGGYQAWIAGSPRTFILSFMKNCQTFFQSACTILHSYWQFWEFRVVSLFSLFNVSHLMSVKWSLTGFNLHLPSGCWCGVFFICSLAIRKATFVKYLFKYFTYSSFYFYSLVISPLSDIFIENILFFFLTSVYCITEFGNKTRLRSVIIYIRRQKGMLGSEGALTSSASGLASSLSKQDRLLCLSRMTSFSPKNLSGVGRPE